MSGASKSLAIHALIWVGACILGIWFVGVLAITGYALFFVLYGGFFLLPAFVAWLIAGIYFRRKGQKWVLTSLFHVIIFIIGSIVATIVVCNSFECKFY